jgi:SAM-dependent methyltransferase
LRVPSEDAGSAEYQRQVAAQIAQYAEAHDIHEGTRVAHWMNGRFLAARIRRVFGVDGVAAFYARYLGEAVQRCGIAEVVSLGSGYGALEIEIARWARDRGGPRFRITCLELSPVLVERAREGIRAAGLEQAIRVVAADLNRDLPLTQPVAAFMAHHALHHIVELERLFDQVAAWLHPEGSLVTMDMIGRNGHMRWPETLSVIRGIWPLLPDRLKRDLIFQRLDRWYENWDCSIEGFEGIRAQDILPALIDRRFRFERFFATGGLADVFYDRRFGHNFDLDDSRDVLFLERVQALEDRMLAGDAIKPVCMYAVLRSPRSQGCPPQPVCTGGMTPAKAVRLPDMTSQGALAILAETGFGSPYPPPMTPRPPAAIECNRPVRFARDGDGNALRRWGWSDPEDDFCWSLGVESALEFSVTRHVHAIDLRFIAYRPPGAAACSLSFAINGNAHSTIDLTDHRISGHRLQLRESIAPGSTALLELTMSRPRRPDVDGGGDKRPIGIALIAMTLL